MPFRWVQLVRGMLSNTALHIIGGSIRLRSNIPNKPFSVSFSFDSIKWQNLILYMLHTVLIGSERMTKEFVLHSLSFTCACAEFYMSSSLSTVQARAWTTFHGKPDKTVTWRLIAMFIASKLFTYIRSFPNHAVYPPVTSFSLGNHPSVWTMIYL